MGVIGTDLSTHLGCWMKHTGQEERPRHHTLTALASSLNLGWERKDWLGRWCMVQFGVFDCRFFLALNRNPSTGLELTVVHETHVRPQRADVPPTS